LIELHSRDLAKEVEQTIKPSQPEDFLSRNGAVWRVV
jgi:hypothetical protein